MTRTLRDESTLWIWEGEWWGYARPGYRRAPGETEWERVLILEVDSLADPLWTPDGSGESEWPALLAEVTS